MCALNSIPQRGKLKPGGTETMQVREGRGRRGLRGGGGGGEELDLNLLVSDLRELSQLEPLRG